MILASSTFALASASSASVSLRSGLTSTLTTGSTVWASWKDGGAGTTDDSAGALTLGVTIGGLISGSSACRGGNGETPGYGRGDSTLIDPDEC
jgi:hypothetical protein